VSKLALALIEQHDHITQLWYDAWRESKLPHLEITEAALKDHLSPQLLRIGEQMKDLSTAKSPEENWQIFNSMDPEARVDQNMPIEEVVMEFSLALDVLRQWIKDQKIEPSFDEFSYLYQNFFELTSESVRRYQVYRQEQISQERSRYLAGLTHQMRTPISTLMMQMQIIERQREVTPSFINVCQRNLKRLSLMVNTVMRLERFKPNELPVRPRLIYPARLIDQSVDDYQPEASHKGLRLEVDADRTLDMYVDPDLLLDALGNLIDNAVKYTTTGYVRVEVRTVSETNEVSFTVSDSGPGIPPDRQEGLFGPLKPVELSGAGIGMHVAQRAVTAMGGTIGIKSILGQGTSVWFRLPKSLSAESNAANTTTL
jgi:two-component system, OmpR family, sensor histidine kinase SenX3